MRQIFASLFVVFAMLPVSAMAGFEWIPPAKLDQQRVMTPEQPMPNAMPAAPVMAEPLSAPMQMQQAPRNVPAPQRVSSKTTGGLYIDPYPLQKNPSAQMAGNVDQAMMEKSRALNPVQLGSGMTTGVKPKKMAGITTGSSQPKAIASFGTDSLTPMMGGEPAPLPGFSRGGVTREPLRQYAQAVGFGKELPLALALSQIIPSEFTHRFEGDVNPAVTVSWEGGKPWNLVLADMLAAQNLTANIEDNIVIIRSVASV